MHSPVTGRWDQQTLPMRSMIWLLANAVDCEALGLWCRTNVGCDRVETFIDVDRALARCERARPTLLVVDPSAGEMVITRAVAAQHGKLVKHVLVFDRRPREGRLVDILAEPATSYLSRTVAPAALAAAIQAILAHGTRVIDPALAPRLRATRSGYEFIEASTPGSVAALTVRERQVMRLLAQGTTVRECAEQLGLATSTIDNHKARLMKKLGLHKASELTCRAVREGLVVI